MKRFALMLVWTLFLSVFWTAIWRARATVDASPPPADPAPRVVDLPPIFDGMPVDMWCHCHKDPADLQVVDSGGREPPASTQPP